MRWRRARQRRKRTERKLTSAAVWARLDREYQARYGCDCPRTATGMSILWASEMAHIAAVYSPFPIQGAL